MENESKKTNKLKNAKIAFIIIFAIATIVFCLMPLTFDAKKGSLLKEISIPLMIVDAILWFIAFFGFLICCLLGQIKKTNPSLYQKLTRFSNSSDGDTSMSSQSFTQKIAYFFINIWNNSLIMFIITGLLFIGAEIICVILENQVTYLIVELIYIVTAVCISAIKGWNKLPKTLFIYIVWGIITTFMGEIWLIVGLVLLGIAAPFVINATENCTTKTKAIALICTISLVIGLCAVAKILPSGNNSNETEACGICGGSGTVTSKILGEGSGIQKGFDTYYRCKGCHGTGRD